MLPSETLNKYRAKIGVLAPAMVMNAAIVAGAAWWLHAEHADKELFAAQTLNTLADSVARQIESTYVRAADHTRAAALRGSDKETDANSATLQQDHVAVVIDDHLNALSLNGKIPIRNYGPRNHIRSLAEAAPNAIVPEPPTTDAGGGKPYWPFAAAFASRRNGLIGVASRLSFEDMQLPLEAVRLKPGGTMLLVRNDGIIVAAAPWRGEWIGRRASAVLAVENEHYDDRDAPSHISAGRIDAEMHLFATAQMTGIPLRVIAAAPEQDFFMEWRTEAAVLAMLALMMAATSAFAARRQFALLAELDAGNRKLQEEVHRKGAILNAEIKEREEQERLARMLRDALEHSGIMVLITDVDGRIEYANPAFYQATGYDPLEVLGKPPSMLRHPELSHPQNDLWPTIMSGKTWTGTFCNSRRNGTELWVSATISPVSDADGRITHFVAVEEDATKRRVYESELQNAKKQAEAASLAKSEFLSSMSHEMRTPMNAIMGFAQLLASNDKQPLPERQKFYAETILKSGQHLLTLVNDILDLARIESGRLPLSFEPVSLDRVMAEVLTMIQPLADRRRITLIDDATGKGVPFIEADYTRLKQVLINLGGNAVKYNHSGGQVRFMADYSETGPIRITVEDTGVGIPEKRRDEVFRPFARLGAENSAVEGTGIGLAVCKVLVEAMGGGIDFFSAEGGGAAFWVELPRSSRLPAQEPCCAAPTAAKASDAQADCMHTILYIEDNPSNVELMEEILSQDADCNCNLISAASAEAGLEKAAQTRPDLIVMDINLPGMSGIEAVGRIKADPQLRNVPVLALSADVMPDTIRTGMKAGFLRYLRKPLDVAEFRQILRQLNAVKKN